MFWKRNTEWKVSWTGWAPSRTRLQGIMQFSELHCRRRLAISKEERVLSMRRRSKKGSKSRACCLRKSGGLCLGIVRLCFEIAIQRTRSDHMGRSLGASSFRGKLCEPVARFTPKVRTRSLVASRTSESASSLPGATGGRSIPAPSFPLLHPLRTRFHRRRVPLEILQPAAGDRAAQLLRVELVGRCSSVESDPAIDGGA